MGTELKGRHAIVTGGSAGIGAAIVSAFAKEGAKVSFCYVGDAAAAGQIAAQSDAIFAYECDVSDPAQVEKFVAAARDRHGPVDVLVNNAGISITHRFEDISLAEFDKILGVHLRGTFLMCSAVYAEMKARKWGRIINISSQLAFKGGVELAHYCAAKAGVIGLTKALAAEGAAHGVIVNAIAPGPVETAILHVLSQEWRDRKQAELPIGRFGEVDEIAPAAVFLASERASFMVGSTMHVNGGDIML
jgi:3-oxoacyl-[acyl-carrier protein] reductase